MPYRRRKSTLSRETSSSSSQSSQSSLDRKCSHGALRSSRLHRYDTRGREDRFRRDVEDRFRRDVEDVVGAVEGISVGKRIHKTVEKLENPVKKLGKFVLWSAPLILAGLEVRHEWHHHAHKRKMMEKEYEKAHLEIQLQLGKDGKKEGLRVEGTKSQEPAQKKEEAPASSSEEIHILPYPSQAKHRSDRLRYRSQRDLEICQPYLLPPLVPELSARDVWEARQPRIRVKPPGYREVIFPRTRSWSESVYEYRRW
ncbi:hypothetical protein EYC80_005270 [Monilinia laxa]|uniref:Uncharacterized protein n=1 Tax=Monilinia laxa TaxID=61186 RepID=A0A5N6KJP5_MONLA|nr:hypothetical protein EYC80_005270 [Monilinia laxa]